MSVVTFICSQYQYFGVEFWGECWTGPLTPKSLKIHPKSDQCYQAKTNLYVGKMNAVYIYKFNPGMDFTSYNVSNLSLFKMAVLYTNMKLRFKPFYPRAVPNA